MTNNGLEKRIRAIVDSKPGISQKAIVQELKDEASHNTVRHAIKSMAKAEELHEVKQGKRTMYFGPDKGEKFIEKSLEIDVDKIRKMLDDVKKKSGNSSYVHNRHTIKKLKNILPVIESIERHDEFLKIQLEPRTWYIDEKVESVLKLLDGNLERRQELTEIIHGIKTKLCELDRRRIEHLKELYNARSDGRFQSIEYDVDGIENVYESHYSELNNLELCFTSGKLSIQYIRQYA